MEYKYYKFPNKESVPEIKLWPLNISIYEIGLIKKESEITDDWGNEIKPAEYYEGWHINVCYEGTPNLDFVKEFEINVNNPRYRWFTDKK